MTTLVEERVSIAMPSSLDRCDSCIQVAVAAIEVSADLPVLMLCGHHWRKSAAAVRERGYEFAVEPENDSFN